VGGRHLGNKEFGGLQDADIIGGCCGVLLDVSRLALLLAAVNNIIEHGFQAANGAALLPVFRGDKRKMDLPIDFGIRDP
jgi:hypothetical protein